MKLSALETIDSYPKEWPHVYTDSSAYKATVNAGYRAILYHPDGTETKIYDACGSFNSNFVAEKEAITHAVKHLNNMFDTNGDPKSTVIITDSLYTLQALKSGGSGDRYQSNVKLEMDKLISRLHIRGGMQKLNFSRDPLKCAIWCII